MERSKKVVVLCHCILNCHAKVIGLAKYKSCVKQLVQQYIDEDVAMVQLPCPEISFLGLKRWGMTKEQYQLDSYRKHCTALLTPYVEQIKMYIEEGYELLGFVGVDCSPSCGVNYSCKGYTGGDVNAAVQTETITNEMGVFSELFQRLLSEEGIDIPFSAIDEREYYT